MFYGCYLLLTHPAKYIGDLVILNLIGLGSGGICADLGEDLGGYLFFFNVQRSTYC